MIRTPKEIAYNCKQATFLIEKKQVLKLSVTEKLELKMHLAGCTVCRFYEKQSIFITKITKHIFNERGKMAFRVPDNVKEEMQKRIEEELNKVG